MINYFFTHITEHPFLLGFGLFYLFCFGLTIIYFIGRYFGIDHPQDRHPIDLDRAWNVASVTGDLE